MQRIGIFSHPSPRLLVGRIGFARRCLLLAAGMSLAVSAMRAQTAHVQSGGIDAGTVAVGQSAAALTLTFVFDTGGSLGTPPVDVLTQGAANQDFADAGTGSCTTNGSSHVYATGNTCTVMVTFAPKFAGTRYGAVTLIDSSGNTVGTGGVQGTGTGPQVNFLPGVTRTVATGFSSPQGIAVDGNGNVYVAHATNNSIEEIQAAGGAPRTIGSGFTAPDGIAVDGAGDIFVADLLANEVYEVVAVGGTIPGAPVIRSLGSFSGPLGIAVDSHGNVFVGAYSGHQLQEIVAATGTTRTLESGSFFDPLAVAVDASGDVFVVDYFTGLQEILAVNGSIPDSPTIRTLGEFAGANSVGMAVDGTGNLFVASGSAVTELLAVDGSIPASPSSRSVGGAFNDLTGIAVAGNGDVFVTDQGNNAVEEIDLADGPSLAFPTATTNGTVDTTDGAMSFQVVNDGNETLTAIAPGLSASSGFTTVAGSGTPPDCGTSFSLAAGATCNVSVQFTPAGGSGAVSGQLTLTDDSGNATAAAPATQTVTLGGTAIQPATTLTLTANPATGVFGKGATITATLSPYMAGAYTTNGQTVTFGVSGPNPGPGAMYTATLMGGVATLELSLFAVGTIDVAASFQDLTSFFAGSSGQTSINVIQATTTLLAATAAGQPATTVAAGTPLTLTATVASVVSPPNYGSGAV